MRKNIIFEPERSKKPFIVFTVLSVLIILFPLQSPVNSVKALLSYIFVPQIRASHGAAEYFQGSYDSVKELIDAHYENTLLKEEIKDARLARDRAQALEEENERLSALLKIPPSKKWNGVWAKTAYRDPSRWSSIIVDKGVKDGVAVRSAVIGAESGQIGLVGQVIETGDNTSKIMLVNDPDFNAAASLEPLGTDGLLTGMDGQYLKLKYIPLGTTFEAGGRVDTSVRSAVFPAGIAAGVIAGEEKGDDFKTSITLNVIPAVNPAAVREVFIITEKK